MQKKALLVQNFGVLKAQRATASLITNKVDDDGVTDKQGKGTRDQSILQRAQDMDKQLEQEKKNGENSLAFKRMGTYSK